MSRRNHPSGPTPEERRALLGMLEEARRDHRLKSAAERRSGRWLIGILAALALFAFGLLLTVAPANPALAIAAIVSGAVAFVLFAIWRRQASAHS